MYSFTVAHVTLLTGKTDQKRKILLLGSGYVAGPCAEYLLRRPENELTIGKRSLKGEINGQFSQ
jgi:hypothetical protein